MMAMGFDEQTSITALSNKVCAASKVSPSAPICSHLATGPLSVLQFGR